MTRKQLLKNAGLDEDNLELYLEVLGHRNYPLKYVHQIENLLQDIATSQEELVRIFAKLKDLSGLLIE